MRYFASELDKDCGRGFPILVLGKPAVDAVVRKKWDRLIEVCDRGLRRYVTAFCFFTP